jgi:TetR/AcrR family transcriptional repressor of nem operon
MRKRPRSRAEGKQATRAALIAAGITELAAHGLDASLDGICARAKRTRGAFYVHFADRDAFIVAVMEHVLGTFFAAITAAPLDRNAMARLFFAAVAARAPIVSGGSGLHFHHILEACRRSQAIGDAYRGLVVAARDRLAQIAPAQADLMIATALGVTAAVELDLPLDYAAIEAALTRP